MVTPGVATEKRYVPSDDSMPARRRNMDVEIGDCGVYPQVILPQISKQPSFVWRELLDDLHERRMSVSRSLSIHGRNEKIGEKFP